MKKSILFIIFSVITCISNAQITTDEQPYGLLMKSGSISTQSVSVQKKIKTFTDVYKANIAAEDLVNDAKPGPLRYAFAVPTDYTLENSGTWQELNGGKLWRLQVKMSGALSTNTYYDKFWLPEGAKFFVYSEETQQYIGAISSEFIGGSKKQPEGFATALIYGENVVFEYYQPASVTDSAIISISRIDYGYRYIDNPYVNILQNFGDAGDCQVNINCSEGNNWQNEKHAVARVTIPLQSGTYFCSCALINNTANDYTPYVLTANHCLVEPTTGVSVYDAVNTPNANGMVFYWKYEHSGCTNSSTQPTLRTTTGATVKANNSVSDFALLQLTQDPRNVSGITPYYLGWDRSGNVGTGGVGIHHPSGDVKKIATHDITPYTSNCFTNTSYSNNNFWKVNWQATTNGHSVTEGGSSGSPLINNSHHIIGQLYGAGLTDICPNPNCSNPSADIANYGKFSVSWTGNGSTLNSRKLQPWLDPVGTNSQTIDGTSAATISGTSTVCYSGSTFSIANLPSGATVQWSITGNNFSLSNATNSSVTVTRKIAGNNSSAQLRAIINTGSIRDTLRKTVTPCIPTITGEISCETGEGTFTVTNIPQNYASQVVWTCSSNLQMTGNNTGITKSFRLISLNAYNAWIKVSINSQTIAERTVNYPNIGQGAYISGPNTMTLNSTIIHILKNFTDPIVIEEENVENLCYDTSWSCSANLKLYPVSSSAIPERSYEDPEEPEEPEEPMIEITRPVYVKAVGLGTGWINVDVTVNGISKTITKVINVVQQTHNQSMSVTLNHYSVMEEPEIYVTAITSPTANTYKWVFDDSMSCPVDEDGNDIDAGIVTHCPYVLLNYNPNITPRLVTLTVTASDSVTGLSGTDSYSVYGNYIPELFCAELSCLAYPNPVSDILNIEITPQLQGMESKQALSSASNRNYDVSLYTVLGNQVLHTSGGVGKTMINVSDIPSGVYILRIHDGVTKPVTRSIIVEH